MKKYTQVETLCLMAINCKKAHDQKEGTKDFIARLTLLEAHARSLLSERATIQLQKEEKTG